MKLVALWAVLTCLVLPLCSAQTDKVVCYYGSWSTYRSGNGRFTVEDIDPTLCTHIIYTFIGLNSDNTIRLLDPGNDITNRGFQRFVGLRSRNPNVKLMIAIGGFNEGSNRYSIMANSLQGRTTFINSVVSFMKTYGFDGFDLDWEYPGMRGGAASDRAAFTQLMMEMRTVFDRERWLLTAAVAAVRSYHTSSYEVPNLSRYLDFINVMAYDLHGSWDGVTGQNAPLYASSWETTDWNSQLNVDAVMRAWIASGASPQKLVMGVGFYGRSYTLASAVNNGVGAPTIGAGAAGPYTQEPGFLGYMEICERIRNNGWVERWDSVQQNPYAFSGNQWVGYDSVQSLTLKVQRAKAMNLGGVMSWSIDTDDFRNVCGQGTYPLLRALNREIGTGGASTTTTTTSPPATTTTTVPGASTTTTTRATTTTTRATTTTTRAATTTAGSNTTPSTQLCNQSGFMRDPANCNRFYRCDPATNTILGSAIQCPATLVFDIATSSCNYAYAVQC